MKKLLLFLTIICTLPHVTHTNGNSKDSIFLNDGSSFSDFEKKLRAKHPNLNIPQIRIAQHPSQEFTRLSRQKEKTEITLNFNNKNKSTEYNSAQLEFFILMESAQALKPYDSVHTAYPFLISTLSTPFIWGIHRKTPYKNIFTKLGSKALATIGISTLFACLAIKLEEHWNQDFLNKHADKETLLSAIELFNKAKEKNLNKASDIDNQIAKIKRVLKKHFSTEA